MSKKNKNTESVGLRDIAKQLNVSISTVSRALNGDVGVGQVRTASILATAKKMGYRPQPLRRRSRRAIGLVVSTAIRQDGLDPNERYFQQLSWWMERIVSSKNLHLHLHFVDREDKSPQIPLIVQENRVDGIILAGHPSEALCGVLKENSVPAVVVSDTVERTGLDCIMIDETPAIDQLVRQLAAMGHRDIAWVSTDRRFPVIAAAEDAFINAAASHGLEIMPERIIRDFEPNLSGGRQAAEILTGGNSIPTAAVFANDWMAFGALGQIQRRGLEVPRDISIIGRGNDSICDEIDPPLTSIDRCVGGILNKALDVLLEKNWAEACQQQYKLTAKIEWRNSCSAPSQS